LTPDKLHSIPVSPVWRLRITYSQAAKKSGQVKLPVSAGLIDINTVDGTWNNIVGVTNVTGENTSEIRWGSPVPSGGQKSGYRFGGNAERFFGLGDSTGNTCQKPIATLVESEEKVSQVRSFGRVSQYSHLTHYTCKHQRQNELSPYPLKLSDKLTQNID
jgi:hypothetical protein